MKKRIALLLVLVLALSFVLASCGEKACETCTDANEDGVCDVCGGVVPFRDLTVFNLYDYDGSWKTEDHASISKAVTFEYKGDITRTTDTVVVTREMDTTSHDVNDTPTNNDDDVDEITYVYRVYSLATGKIITSYEARPNWDDFYYNYSGALNESTKIKNVSVLLPGDEYDDDKYVPYGYVAVSTQLWNSKANIYIYKIDGTELVKAENLKTSLIDTALDFFGDDHFVVADVLYRIEADGTKTTVVDTKITNLYRRYGNTYSEYDFQYMNGKYYAFEYNNDSIANVTVFDGNFNFVKYVDIPDRFEMQMEEMYTDTYVLANGNVFVRYCNYGVAVDRLLPTDTYDYVVDGYAYSYDDVIVNTETGEVTDIEDLPFVNMEIYTVKSVGDNMSEYAIKIKEGVTIENMIWGYEIVDGVVSGEASNYALTNEGTLKNKFVGFDGFGADDCYVAYALSADALVFETPAGTYLYKVDGTKVGMFPGNIWSSIIGYTYIKYGDDIYDFALNKVFTIDKDMKGVVVANDAIYYYKYTKQIDDDEETTNVDEYVDGYKTYYVWNGANKEIAKIYDDDAARTGFYAYDNGYYVKGFTKAVADDAATPDVNEYAAAKYTYTFYTSAGVKVDEIVVTTTTTTVTENNVTTTTVVANAIEVDSIGGNTWIVLETVTTTVTEGTKTPVETVVEKIHAIN